ncbi:MAG: RpiB/LacA/LacB family sugar-phosphate isomerase [Anaerolineales bacterium]|nr:RpiB/LacA/LacB family sugar-phosphate isomerase [Anaerolineales bacterium]MCX7756343.1 RpiB/LacA/LacB family sugar-phosphate isomerase [Anaerolineales bacterium]MDW8276677.1 RpiB/LacA/LacB family sugar-phosphate isomerase [Anaerolineales bacterium]
MKIALGADERLPVVETIQRYLSEHGHHVLWFGPLAEQTSPWPHVARQVAEQVAAGEADEGILLCWTGTGVSIAANKVRGIRAALCTDAETARGARLWNNANVLCLSMRLTTDALAKEILDSWFATSYQPNPTDDACLQLIDELDRA